LQTTLLTRRVATAARRNPASYQVASHLGDPANRCSLFVAAALSAGDPPSGVTRGWAFSYDTGLTIRGTS